MSRPARLPLDDDLFRPTITNVPRPAKPPYLASSLFYVGIIGGPVAATAVALVNSGRLGVGGTGRRRVLAAGAGGVLLMLAMAAWGGATAAGFAIVVSGLLAALAQTRLRRARDRYWSARRVARASQVRIGLVAGFVGLLVSVAATQAVGAP